MDNDHIPAPDDPIDDAVHSFEHLVHSAADSVDNFLSPHLDVSPALLPGALTTPLFPTPGTIPGITPLPGFDPLHVSPADIIGDPVDDAACWHIQDADNTCAIASQQFVIEQVLHQPVSEAELTQLAEDHGWFDPTSAGTNPMDTGELLKLFGLQVVQHQGGTFDELADEVAKGHHPIVGLRGQLIWHSEPDADLSNAIVHPGVCSNHAVEVIGIDRTDPTNPQVILNDSGNPDGQGERVDLKTFEDAWTYSNNFAVYSW